MSGPLFFAWIAEPIPFDPLAHAIEDEQILSLQLSQQESEFASLEITLKNSGAGLLAPGRMQWCWLSWDDGEAVVPLFLGRLIAVPEQIEGEAYSLQFAARPSDFDDRKKALAESLKQLPFYDRVWIAADEEDLDVVIETRGADWHIDRVTHEVTITDHLQGEDGLIAIGGNHIYDQMSVAYGDKPATSAAIEATITWKQTGKGTIDISRRIYDASRAEGSIYNYPGSNVIASLTADGLKSDWPKGGTSLDGGWTVNNDTYVEDADKNTFNYCTFDVNYFGYASDSTATENTAEAFFATYTEYTAKFPVVPLKQVTKFDWAADRSRTETLRCTMYAAIQPLVVAPDDTEITEEVTLSAPDTVTEADDAGVMPIGDQRRASYLDTDRGRASAEYVMLLARARLRSRARAVEVQCRVPWSLGIGATLRKSASLDDARLPGGTASGKITEYKFVAGPEGWYCDLTLGCAIGYGGTVVAVSGAGSWSELDYTGAEYQDTVGGQSGVPTDDIVYSNLSETTIDDDGVDLIALDATTAVETLTIGNGLADQAEAVFVALDPVETLKGLPTLICLQLVPLAGQEFETVFTPAIEPVPIPQTVNLEAP